METVYLLKDQVNSIRSMQEASQSHPSLGLKITHGLIGSQEWWDNIASGKLPLFSVRGIVRGLWLGMHHSEEGSFAMELLDGGWFRDATMLEAAESAEKFTLGRYVEVDYVNQELKTPIEGINEPSRVVLAIRVDSTSAPGVEPIGPCYFTWKASQESSDTPTPTAAGVTPIRRARWWQIWR